MFSVYRKFVVNLCKVIHYCAKATGVSLAGTAQMSVYQALKQRASVLKKDAIGILTIYLDRALTLSMSSSEIGKKLH